MRTPIYDFLQNYSKSGVTRLHMPGHKGQKNKIYALDITEIAGADSLYEASGIIKESENNASEIFGAHTFYSTEGSSLAIRAMMHLCCLYAASKNEKPLILAGRNAHKVFLSSAALLDFEIEWLYGDNYLSCHIDPEILDKAIKRAKRNPTAVYITSPDYLGGRVDIRAIADVCKSNGVLLVVDNAHGSYLKFLPKSEHPIDLGADMCADSAHKTLPVLTGGAYLHVSKNAPRICADNAKEALLLFGSTSPSYMILSSLDSANPELSTEFIAKMSTLVVKIANFKKELEDHGYVMYGNEPTKITIMSKAFGYLGTELAEILQKQKIYVEFADKDFLVLMFSPYNSEDDIERTLAVLTSVERRTEILSKAPRLTESVRAISVRNAMLSASELISVDECEGRILSNAHVGCPPAVPIVISGEIITRDAIDAMKYYGIESAQVLKR